MSDFWGVRSLDRRVAQLEQRARQQMGHPRGATTRRGLLEQAATTPARVADAALRLPQIGQELAEGTWRWPALPNNVDLPDRDLRFLAGTPEMAAYRRDLWWAQEYARRNRAVMLALLCGVIREAFPQAEYDEPISCHHNYVAEETYDGVEVLVTRKGAIRAGRGDLGIIPGSMGTGSYIVRWRGNRTRTARRRTGGAGDVSGTGEANLQHSDLAAQTAGVEAARTPGWSTNPGAYRTHPGDGAAGGPVEVVAHLKQGSA